MEKELKQQFNRIRLATIAIRHNVRHTVDEFRERFVSWRPTESAPILVSTPEPLAETSIFSRLSFDRRLALRWVFGALLFLFAGIAGIALKSLAGEHITIGHEDYRLTPSERLYDLNVLREKALANGAALTVDSRPTYPVCTDDIDTSVDEAAL